MSGNILTSIPSLLAEPPMHLDDFPPFLPDTSEEADEEGLPVSPKLKRMRDFRTKIRSIQRPAPEDRELHIHRLVGLDVDEAELERAKELLTPCDHTLDDPDDLGVTVYIERCVLKFWLSPLVP